MRYPSESKTVLFQALRLAVILGSLGLLWACATTSGEETSCERRFRLSDEGKSIDRCLSFGGVAVFQGESGTFADCRFQPGKDAPSKRQLAEQRP